MKKGRRQGCTKDGQFVSFMERIVLSNPWSDTVQAGPKVEQDHNWSIGLGG